MMSSELMSTRLRAWLASTTPGARVIGCSVRPLPGGFGGAVAARVEQITLHLAGPARRLDLVRKHAHAHEIAGLRAAQTIRPQATAVPQIVDWGTDWLITPLAAGSPLPRTAVTVPDNLIDSLARLHSHFDRGADVPEAVPRVTAGWWQRLCRHWVDPGLGGPAGHPATVMSQARTLVAHAADHPAVPAVLGRLRPTLLHGDVHHGNVLVSDDTATLIDWGSSRVGPAALDLANLVTADSSSVARYAGTWRQLTGRPLSAHTIELGFRWAALQIPVQYLPWWPNTGPQPRCRPPWNASNRR